MANPTQRPIDIYKTYSHLPTTAPHERVQKEKIKHGKVLKTIEDFDYAKKNIVFGVNTASAIHMGWRHTDGTIYAIDIVTPAMRVEYGQSLDGLGGTPILQDNTVAKRQFSLVLVNGDLFPKHAQLIDDNPKNKNLKRKETVEALLDFLFHLRVLFCLFKARNVDAHVKCRSHLSAKAEENSEANFHTDMEYQNQQLFIFFWNNMKSFHVLNSKDAEKNFGVKGLQEIKLTKNDFFLAKEDKDRAKNKAIPIDPRIMKIYHAGENPSNPSYAFAKEVFENHQKGNQFTPLNVTKFKSDKPYPPFGPYCGSNSTVSVRFTIGSWEKPQQDGLKGYIVSIEVLLEEHSSNISVPLHSGYDVDTEANGDGLLDIPQEGESNSNDTEHKDKKLKLDG